MRKFTTKEYSWTLNGLTNCIKDNKMKSKIICSTNKAAIVHVANYDESVALGAESDWCISQHKESWRKYVTDDNNVQLFIYDFSKTPSYDDSLIGATFSTEPNGKAKLICSFVRPNYPVHELFENSNDKDALWFILKSLFGDFEKNLDEAVCSIRGSYKVTESSTSFRNESKESSPSLSYVSMPWDDEPEEWDMFDYFLNR